MFNLAKSCQAFFSLLSRLLVAQFRDIFYELDIVKDVTEVQYNAIMAKAVAEKDKPFSVWENIWRKRIFIFPFCTLAQHPLDSLLVFARYHFKYDPHGMPELLSHRFFPRALWTAGDLVINFGFPIAFFVHLFMLIYPDMDPNYVIYAVKSEQKNKRIRVYSHGKQWPRKQAERLLTFRAKGLAASRFVMVTAFIQTAGYFCGNNFINSKPFESWPQFCFMLFSPFVALWADFGVVFTSFYIALTGHYTYIKQQFILAKIKSLTKKLSKKRHPTIAEWKRFTVINTEVLKLFDEIRMYNRFWAPFLTVTLIGHISLDTLLAYAWVKARGRLGWVEQSFNAYFAIECFVLILFITNVCSSITRGNIRIYKTNTQMCYAFMKTKGLPNTIRLNMSKMISNFRGYRIGFKMTTGTLIDSKFFELIFAYTSVIFMRAMRQIN